ncbi:hypothetical protein Ahy_B09g097468 [Arachis hypogaea]|uniref:Uncharacterized protein n=1 Tax=Arachis hypogaea TaxID=3818 RepID=A0A444XPE7_ARAHY|nr:hypothetical protein Ahy_B09g097468 [Arachis hypogaea]
MVDELSNVNGGSSTNDSIPVIVQSADVTSRSEGVIGSERNNSQNPQQHSEYSRDYNVGSTSNAANSLAVYRQQVEESHHDLVNLLTQQMTTILNPMMADHESKFECLARQVEQIARIVDYEEGERRDARRNNEGFENVFQNETNILNRENPHIVPRGQDANEVLARLLVKIAVMGLGFYMRRKSEQKLKSKPFTRKEKVAYVTMESSEEELNLDTEVDLAELKKGPPYIVTCLCVHDVTLYSMLKI